MQQSLDEIILKLKESHNLHAALSCIAVHPLLSENGWMVAEALTPLIADQCDEAVAILNRLPQESSPKELIMGAISVLSSDHSQNAQVLINYGRLFLNGTCGLQLKH